MWHTFGRAIDTCFARKNQLTIAASAELFRQVARIKTSVVQGISIHKAASHLEQCMLHGLGMLFVGASEPSSYVFPLVPHATVSDLPGAKTYSQIETILYWENLYKKEEARAKPLAKRVRERPNVSKYINDIIATISKRLAAASAPMAPALTVGLSSHALHRASAVNTNACPQLPIQWISTYGAWFLESLTTAFAYVGTTIREDQSVGKVLTGYKDPHLPYHHDGEGPSLWAGVLPASDAVRPALQERQRAHRYDVQRRHQGLECCAGILLIHLDVIAAETQKEQARSGSKSHYPYRFHEALDSTIATMDSFCRSKLSSRGGISFGLRGRQRTSLRSVIAAPVTPLCLQQPSRRCFPLWRQCSARYRSSAQCRSPTRLRTPAPRCAAVRQFAPTSSLTPPHFQIASTTGTRWSYDSQHRRRNNILSELTSRQASTS
jgi:hypothetical protein